MAARGVKHVSCSQKFIESLFSIGVIREGRRSIDEPIIGVEELA